MDMEKVEKLSNILRASKRIVFFGGAGVSTESGIPDFRSAKGLYNQRTGHNVSPEEMVTHTYLVEHPEEFFDFYKKRMIFMDVEPNKCHYALVKLEKMGKLTAVITQNIDGLHQKAGSQNVMELHGTILRNYCLKCGADYDVKYVVSCQGIPKCEKCGGTVRPDVVLYEEGLDMDLLEAAALEISRADTIIIGGTSLVVNPAAGLIRYFKGTNMVLINKSETQADNWADLVIRDSIGEVMDKAVSIM